MAHTVEAQRVVISGSFISVMAAAAGGKMLLGSCKISGQRLRESWEGEKSRRTWPVGEASSLVLCISLRLAYPFRPNLGTRSDR
uniref:Uncharacterized protein n=1 Tax=Arundo donax TaxID=35708 RepID=A0A0A8YLK4_ARUDO